MGNNSPHTTNANRVGLCLGLNSRVELKHECRLKAKTAWGRRDTHTHVDENRHRRHYAKCVSGQTVTICSCTDGRDKEGDRENERERMFFRWRTIEEWRNRILTDEDMRLFYRSPDDNDEVCSSGNVLCFFILVESFNEGRSQQIHAQQCTHTYTQWLLIDRNTPGCR